MRPTSVSGDAHQAVVLFEVEFRYLPHMWDGLRRAQTAESISKVMSCFSHEEQDRLREYLLTMRSKALEELGIKYEMALPLVNCILSYTIEYFVIICGALEGQTVGGMAGRVRVHEVVETLETDVVLARSLASESHR